MHTALCNASYCLHSCQESFFQFLTQSKRPSKPVQKYVCQMYQGFRHIIRIFTLMQICIGAKLGVAAVARATPLFCPTHPKIMYINTLHISAPPQNYLVCGVVSPDWHQCKCVFHTSQISYMETKEFGAGSWLKINGSILLKIKKTRQFTVIPWFMRLLWQPKIRVNRNSGYTSYSIDKKIVKKISIKLNFF